MAGGTALAEDFTTHIINGIAVNTNGTYIVGDTGVSNALVILNAGELNVPSRFYRVRLLP